MFNTKSHTHTHHTNPVVVYLIRNPSILVIVLGVDRAGRLSFTSEQVGRGDAREAAALAQTLRLRATVIKSSGSRWL